MLTLLVLRGAYITRTTRCLPYLYYEVLTFLVLHKPGALLLLYVTTGAPFVTRTKYLVLYTPIYLGAGSARRRRATGDIRKGLGL